MNEEKLNEILNYVSIKSGYKNIYDLLDDMHTDGIIETIRESMQIYAGESIRNLTMPKTVKKECVHATDRNGKCYLCETQVIEWSN